MLATATIVEAYAIAIRFDGQKRELQLVGSNIDQAHAASVDPANDAMVVFAQHPPGNLIDLFTIRFGYLCMARLVPLRRAVVIEFQRLAPNFINTETNSFEYDTLGSPRALTENETIALKEIVSKLL